MTLLPLHSILFSVSSCGTQHSYPTVETPASFLQLQWIVCDAPWSCTVTSPLVSYKLITVNKLTCSASVSQPIKWDNSRFLPELWGWKEMGEGTKSSARHRRVANMLPIFILRQKLNTLYNTKPRQECMTCFLSYILSPNSGYTSSMEITMTS